MLLEYSASAPAPQDENAMPPAILEAWLAYADAGIPTFPATRDKKPLIKNNLVNATTDKEVIRGWAIKFPNASIAMVAGSGSGAVVLDVDNKQGRDGFMAVETLDMLHGPLARDVVRKGGAGEQLFFARPDGVRIKNASDQIAPGLDVRGCAADGSPKGFTILPPSIRPDGTAYSWEGDGQDRVQLKFFPEPPEWLVFLMAFNEREREQLAVIGIKGHEDFGGAPPSDWERLANEKRAASWQAQRAAKLPGGKLPALNPTALGRYLTSAIGSELQSVRQSQPGHQEKTLNEAGLKIHGLLKGAAICGMDVLAMTADVRGLFVAATIAMIAGNPSDPWTEGDATSKWERTEDAAAPRDLFDVALPERAFNAIEPFRGGQTIEAGAPYIQYPDTTDKGTPRETFLNFEAFLDSSGVKIRHDEFAQAIFICAGGTWRKLTDDDAIILRINAQQTGLRTPIAEVFNYLKVKALSNPFHPIKEYLAGISWDGTPRLSTWLTTYLGADDTPLNRAIARLTLIAAVRRTRHPGCKFDTLLVLESFQGPGKSTFLMELAGGAAYFTDAVKLGDDPKTMIEQTAGKWIIEIPELSGVRNAEIENVKAQLSRREDSARPAYGRLRGDVPRQFIMIGTTNGGAGAGAYLKDQTGNRRYLPVQVSKIDVEGSKRDRDQLFAEAAAAEASGESITLPESLWALAGVEQNKRIVRDELETTVSDLIAGKSGFVSRKTIHELLELSPATIRPALSAAIERAMAHDLWKDVRPSIGPPDGEKVRTRGWTKDPNGPVYIFVEGRLEPLKSGDQMLI